MKDLFPDYPKTLDSIITKHKKWAGLHLTTDAEIHEIIRVIVAPEAWPEFCAISNWRFISHRVNMRRTRRINIIGDLSYSRCVVTDWLRGLDLGTGVALTGSGALHQLAGPQGVGEPTEWQLMYVNSYLRKQDTEDYFGIPQYHAH